MQHSEYQFIRGFEIASRRKVKIVAKEPNHWVIATANRNDERNTKYDIRNNSGKYSCTCADHQKRAHHCKHIWAAIFTSLRDDIKHRGREKALESAEARLQRPPKKRSYPRDWAGYRAARVAQKDQFIRLLDDLLGYIPQQERKRGRAVDWRSAVVGTVMKVYEDKSADIFMSDYREACGKGMANEDCCSNTIINHMNRKGLEDILQTLIAVTARPLANMEDVFAIDSTGFGTPRYVTFYDHKYHGHHEKSFMKAHMAAGIRTKIIASVRFGQVGDSVMFPELFRETHERFALKEVLADKAYSTNDVYDIAKAANVRAYIEHKASHTGAKSGDAFRESLRFYTFHQEEFYDKYRMRPNIESAFSMMKRSFGANLRSRLEQAQRNEILCKVLCHNITVLIQSMFVLNVDLDCLKSH